jgi:hypothetical protein
MDDDTRRDAIGQSDIGFDDMYDRAAQKKQQHKQQNARTNKKRKDTQDTRAHRPRRDPASR